MGTAIHTTPERGVEWKPPTGQESLTVGLTTFYLSTFYDYWKQTMLICSP